MKTYFLLSLAFSPSFSYPAAATSVDVITETVEMRQLSPHELQSALYRRIGFGSFKIGGGGIRDGSAGARIGEGISKVINKFHSDDNKRREQFVKDALGKYGKQHPGFNIVVVHTDLGYDKNFEGKEGKDWGKAHEEVPIHIGGGSNGYDIFWFKKGTFVRHEDGGWMNWGYSGKPKREDNKLTY